MKKRAKITSLLLLCLLTLSLTTEKQTEPTHGLTYTMPEPDTVINQPVRVSAFDLPIIPPSSGVQFFKDGIVFMASSKSKVNMLPDHLSFGTISAYYAELSENSLGKSFPFSNSTSFTYPPEAITFNKDHSLMYFTRNAGDGTQKIYRAEYSQGDWFIDQKPMDFCSDNSTYTHPAISLDGKIMVFSSNRPDSYGGMDLYVTLNTDGKWSEPVNIGNAVNSTFNEVFPFLDEDNNLFFSSNNIQGFGGYDIYVCKFDDNTWERPINLATPINTIYDDVAFTIDRHNGKTAFYTVKENFGRSYIQLYKVDMLETSSTEGLNLSQYLTRPDIPQMVILALEPAVQATDRPAETERRTTPREDDRIVYRVQFLTSFNPKTRPQLELGETIYPVFEYLYAGAYRLCVGEYASLSQALKLQRTLIENDYPNATVVVFRNDVMSFDTDLLNEEGIPDTTGIAKQPADAKAVTPVTKPEQKKTEQVKAVIPKTEQKTVPPVKEVTKPVEEKKDVVVYRVQLLSNATAKGSYEIKVNNITYKTYEYFYVGSYRTCIGEFSSLAPARALQNAARKAGYSQAFVVAFKNNVRSTDPELFK
ncbi:MAG: hypothetical protein R6W67_12340 [Bacteroidales bacterium]